MEIVRPQILPHCSPSFVLQHLVVALIFILHHRSDARAIFCVRLSHLLRFLHSTAPPCARAGRLQKMVEMDGQLLLRSRAFFAWTSALSTHLNCFQLNSSVSISPLSRASFRLACNFVRALDRDDGDLVRLPEHRNFKLDFKQTISRNQDPERPRGETETKGRCQNLLRRSPAEPSPTLTFPEPFQNPTLVVLPPKRTQTSPKRKSNAWNLLDLKIVVPSTTTGPYCHQPFDSSIYSFLH